MTPQMLASSGWPSVVKGRVMAPEEPTCNDTVYDFFVVSDALSDSVEAVVRLSDGGCSPH